MNCNAAQQRISAERDGALDALDRQALEQHLAVCAACQQMRNRLETAFASLRVASGATDIPNAEIAWQDVRRQFHGAGGAGRGANRRIVTWFAAPLAAAALAVTIFVGTRRPDAIISSPAVAEVARADDASTMVFVDAKSGWQVVWATGAAPKSG